MVPDDVAADGGDPLGDVVRRGLEGAVAPVAPPGFDDVVDAGRRRRRSTRLGLGGGVLGALLAVVLLTAALTSGTEEQGAEVRVADPGGTRASTDTTPAGDTTVPVTTEPPTTVPPTGGVDPTTTEGPPPVPPTVAPPPEESTTTTVAAPLPVATATLDRTTGLVDGDIVTLDVQILRRPTIDEIPGELGLAVRVEGAGAIASAAHLPRWIEGDRQSLPVMVTPWRADGSSCAPGACSLRVQFWTRTKYQEFDWDVYDIPLEFLPTAGPPPAPPTFAFDPPAPWSVPSSVTAQIDGLRPGEPVEVVYTDCGTGSTMVMDGFKPLRRWVVADGDGRIVGLELRIAACGLVAGHNFEYYELRSALGPAWSQMVKPLSPGPGGVVESGG